MDKNWTWGHPDTDTLAARHGSGDLPEEEHTGAPGTGVPEQGENVRLAGAPSERDDVAVSPALLEEPGHDEALAPAPPDSEHHDTVTPAPDSEHHDTLTSAATEDPPGLDDAVVPPDPVDESAKVTDETPDDVVTERRSTPEEGHGGDHIEQLMDPAATGAFKKRWREVQSDFVDDPYDAVRRADDLASEVLRSLTDALNDHKRRLDYQWHADQDDKSDTERLRQALRGYRDFFDRMVGA